VTDVSDADRYYDDLRAHGDDTTLAGWRHRIEQALRFELAIESVAPDACLLYTSPSPRDRTRSRMPSSA